MRLIDADALLAEYDRMHSGEPGNARKLIEQAPTIPEARLLTKGEVFSAQNMDVWLEESDQSQVHPLLLVETESAERQQIAFFWPAVIRAMKPYGSAWRCWTSRPTDEQRKAVKWDG